MIQKRPSEGEKSDCPLINRVIPVIEDEYVDMEFGTGCLKITPAHDVNDYMLGEKHQLPIIDIFNPTVLSTKTEPCMPEWIDSPYARKS